MFRSAGHTLPHRSARFAIAVLPVVILGLGLLFTIISTAASAAAPQDEHTMLTGMVEASWQWEPSSLTPPPPYFAAPELLERIIPQYTPAATRAGVQGHIIVEAVINNEGQVVEPRILRPSPDDELNRRALEAAGKWRFRAATRDGGPVAVTGLFTFSFRIHGPEELTGARADAVAMGAGGLTAPVLVERELPEYPEGDEYRGIEGDVYIEAVVTTEGTVVEPKLIRGVGNDEMDKRALEAVSKWRFEPGTKDGEPVPVIALFTVTFRVH